MIARSREGEPTVATSSNAYPKLILIDGPPGSGKATLAAGLADVLPISPQPVVIIRGKVILALTAIGWGNLRTDFRSDSYATAKHHSRMLRIEAGQLAAFITEAQLNLTEGHPHLPADANDLLRNQAVLRLAPDFGRIPWVHGLARAIIFEHAQQLLAADRWVIVAGTGAGHDYGPAAAAITLDVKTSSAVWRLGNGRTVAGLIAAKKQEAGLYAGHPQAQAGIRAAIDTTRLSPDQVLSQVVKAVSPALSSLQR